MANAEGQTCEGQTLGGQSRDGAGKLHPAESILPLLTASCPSPTQENGLRRGRLPPPAPVPKFCQADLDLRIKKSLFLPTPQPHQKLPDDHQEQSGSRDQINRSLQRHRARMRRDIRLKNPQHPPTPHTSSLEAHTLTQQPCSGGLLPPAPLGRASPHSLKQALSSLSLHFGLFWGQISLYKLLSSTSRGPIKGYPFAIKAPPTQQNSPQPLPSGKQRAAGASKR